jgi:hypothetical protein
VAHASDTLYRLTEAPVESASVVPGEGIAWASQATTIDATAAEATVPVLDVTDHVSTAPG